MTAEEMIRTRGIKEGIEIGIKEGKAEKSAEVALNLYSLGVSKDIISKGMGLSLDEIDKLIENSSEYEFGRGKQSEERRQAKDSEKSCAL